MIQHTSQQSSYENKTTLRTPGVQRERCRWNASEAQCGLLLTPKSKPHPNQKPTWRFSINGGTSKSCMWIGCSIIKRPFWGYSHYRKAPHFHGSRKNEGCPMVTMGYRVPFSHGMGVWPPLTETRTGDCRIDLIKKALSLVGLVGCHQSGTENGSCQISAATDQTKGQSAEMENTVENALLCIFGRRPRWRQLAALKIWKERSGDNFWPQVHQSCILLHGFNGRCHKQKASNWEAGTGLS